MAPHPESLRERIHEDEHVPGLIEKAAVNKTIGLGGGGVPTCAKHTPTHDLQRRLSARQSVVRQLPVLQQLGAVGAGIAHRAKFRVSEYLHPLLLDNAAVRPSLQQTRLGPVWGMDPRVEERLDDRRPEVEPCSSARLTESTRQYIVRQRRFARRHFVLTRAHGVAGALDGLDTRSANSASAADGSVGTRAPVVVWTRHDTALS